MGIVLRVIIAYTFLWICFRILGKRELTGMSSMEIVTLLLVPQLFSRAITRQDYSMTNAVIGASTLLSLVFLSSMVGYRSRWFGRVLTPEPTVLVDHGALIESHLHRERITPAEIFDAMHRSGIAELEEVRWAVLQADGKIAIIPAERSRPTGPRLT